MEVMGQLVHNSSSPACLCDQLLLPNSTVTKKPFWVTRCLVETSVWLRGILTLMQFLKEIEVSVPSWFPCRGPEFSSSSKTESFF